MITDIDRNFGLHACTIPSCSETMRVNRLSCLSYVDSGLSCDTFNIIHLFDGNNFVEKELEEAVGYYRQRNLDFCLWVSNEDLTPEVKTNFENLGLSVQGEEVGMALELADYETITRVEHNNIRVVNSHEDLSQYADVIARNWNPADENVKRYYDSTVVQYLDKNSGIVFLLYQQDGLPVAGVELFSTDSETAGLYGLATLEAYRGKGIGFALMTNALNMAKASGYKRVILQASEDGIGIYKRLGFKELTNYFEYS